MAISLLLLLPVVASLFWMVVHTLIAPRTSTYRLVLLLLVAAAGSFYSFSCYDSPSVSWRMLDIANMLGLLFGPCLIPLIWMYLERMKPDERYRNSMQLLWIMAPVALFTGALMIHMITGGDKIAIFYEQLYTLGHRKAQEIYLGSLEWHYHRWIAIVSRIVLAIEIIALLAMCITMSRRNGFRTKYLKNFFNGETIKLRQLQMHVVMFSITFLSIKLALPRAFVVEQSWIPIIFTILLTCCISLLSYFALFGDKEDITIQELLHAWRYNYSSENKTEAIDYMIGTLLKEAEEKTLERVYTRLQQRGTRGGKTDSGETEDLSRADDDSYISLGKTRDDNSLKSRFKRIMIEEKVFLQPGLTLQEVADMLQSNKTYISRLVNNTYKQGFPDLVNRLRVGYSKQYILDHRNEKQEAIAQACGFLSASSFNSIFKKITGMTPKVWLARHNNSLGV